MAKYDGLRDYLRQQPSAEVTMTFREIEDILKAPLPPSAARPQWWANVVSQEQTHVQREAWRSAGFDAFLIAETNKVRFVRLK